MNQNSYKNDQADGEVYREARKRVQQKAKFYKHLYTYLIINGLFFIMSLFRGRPFASLPVALMWGVGILFHYLRVFGFPGSGVLSKDWEENEMKREMDRLKKIYSDKDDHKDEPMELKELRKNYDESDFV